MEEKSWTTRKVGARDKQEIGCSPPTLKADLARNFHSPEKVVVMKASILLITQFWKLKILLTSFHKNSKKIF